MNSIRTLCDTGRYSCFMKLFLQPCFPSVPQRLLKVALLDYYRSFAFVMEGRCFFFCLCLIVAEVHLARSQVEIAAIFH